MKGEVRGRETLFGFYGVAGTPAFKMMVRRGPWKYIYLSEEITAWRVGYCPENNVRQYLPYHLRASGRRLLGLPPERPPFVVR